MVRCSYLAIDINSASLGIRLETVSPADRERGIRETTTAAIKATMILELSKQIFGSSIYIHIMYIEEPKIIVVTRPSCRALFSTTRPTTPPPHHHRFLDPVGSRPALVRQQPPNLFSFAADHGSLARTIPNKIRMQVLSSGPRPRTDPQSASGLSRRRAAIPTRSSPIGLHQRHAPRLYHPCCAFADAPPDPTPCRRRRRLPTRMLGLVTHCHTGLFPPPPPPSRCLQNLLTPV